MPMPNDSKVRKPKLEPQVSREVKKKELKSSGTTRKKVEKTQISVRIRKEIMDSYYALAESQGEMKITDMIEEGFYLAVQAHLKRPMVLQQARYLIDNATLDEAWFVVLFLAYLRTRADDLSVYNENERDNVKKRLLMLSTHAYFWDALNSYGRVPGVLEPPAGSALAALHFAVKAMRAGELPRLVVFDALLGDVHSVV
jgi:hypothetical protein